MRPVGPSAHWQIGRELIVNSRLTGNRAAELFLIRVLARSASRMLVVIQEPEGDLEFQRAAIDRAFRHGWASAEDGRPRVLTERAYAEARKVLDQGGWTGLDQATIQAVRDGAQPGDSLPPLQPRPFIDNVTDAEVFITGSGPERRTAVLISHEHFPGIRFGHRFWREPGRETYEDIWLKEEIETGALHRMMQDPPAPDAAGVIWTTWRD
jgi:hypothetical protein